MLRILHRVGEINKVKVMTKNKKQDQPIGHLHFNINNNILLFMRGNKKWRTQKFLQASITN